MNLYAFLSNDPLTTLDEYGLHDVGSLAMLHRWKGDGYAVSPRDQNLMKGYAGAAHGAVQFGVNILHEWQAIATQIGVQQLELGRHGRDAAIGAVERVQSSQSLALDSYLRNQFSVSRTDVSYNTGYAAGMYGAEIGSSIAGGYSIAKGLWQVGRAAYGAYRGGRLFSPTLKLVNMKASPSVLESNAVQNKWIRTPLSIQDRMTLEAAQTGTGKKIIDNLNDYKFRGMEKWEYKVKSANFKDSVVHYVRDPQTGELMDFKFKKRSCD